MMKLDYGDWVFVYVEVANLVATQPPATSLLELISKF